MHLSVCKNVVVKRVQNIASCNSLQGIKQQNMEELICETTGVKSSED